MTTDKRCDLTIADVCGLVLAGVGFATLQLGGLVALAGELKEGRETVLTALCMMSIGAILLTLGTVWRLVR